MLGSRHEPGLENVGNGWAPGNVSKSLVILDELGILVNLCISLIFLVSLGYGSTQDFVKVDWEWNDFWIGFTAFAFQLRLDGLIVVFLLPLTIGLFIKSKTNKYSTSILILIGGILLISPITSGFLNETNQPYRYLSLIVFFAVGVGLLFSRAKTTDIE